jgi:ubiquitin carboxyl-terminal hydrolase 14
MNSQKKLTIKWNKNVIGLDTISGTVGELKEEIAKLTNVEPTRQKLLFKGKFLDENLSISSIPENSVITLMGSASTEMINTDKKIVFLEDLSNEEKAKILKEKGEDLVYGLENLGNTCYLNSTVQCLGRVPELRQALIKSQMKSVQSNNFNNYYLALVKALGETYRNLESKGTTVVPNLLLQVLHALNPMFAEKDRNTFKQQDAEECFSLLLNSIREHLPNENEGEKYSNYLIDELFGIELNIKLQNLQELTETREKKEIVYKLPCFIDSQTTELVAGLKNSLKENVDLNSEILGTSCVFEKSQLITRLPPYLNIQFMRFFWKQANQDLGIKGGKSKILKGVIFSKLIDLYEMCDDGTKEILNIGRAIETKLLKEDKNYKVEKAVNPGDKEMIPTGRYQLIAVLTHQGRSSESGHYIGWANKKDEIWTKYDDDTVSTVNVSDVLELKGGGDWPMAYICIYKRLEVPFMEI